MRTKELTLRELYERYPRDGSGTPRDPRVWWHLDGGWEAFVRACAASGSTVDRAIADDWQAVATDFLHPDAPGALVEVAKRRQAHAVHLYLAAAQSISDEESAKGELGLAISESLRERVLAVPPAPGLVLTDAEQLLYGADHALDIARLLLQLRSAPSTSLRAVPDGGTRVLFPGVGANNGDAATGHGVHASAVEGEGVFLAAQNAFTVLSTGFMETLTRVRPALQRSGLAAGPTRLLIFDYDTKTEQNDRVTRNAFDGRSAGGAAALATHLTHDAVPFADRSWMVSFTLGEGEGADRAYPVGRVVEKAEVIRAGLNGVLFGEFANGREAAVVFDNAGRSDRTLPPEERTLSGIVEAVTGRLKALDDYLDGVVASAKQDALAVEGAVEGGARELPQIYVQVRIARQRIADTYRENHLDGAVDQERAYDANFLRGDPDAADDADIPLLMDWPDFASEGGDQYVRRGVILGDPGFGKSWLLRSEAIHYARRARAEIQAGKTPTTLPIRITLTDLAHEFHSIPEGDIPRALAEAVYNHTLGGQLPRSFKGDLHRAIAEQANRLSLKDADPLGVVLFLDSLDEVPPGATQYLEPLWSWLNVHRGVPAWVTSRAVGYSGLPGWALTTTDPSNPNADDHDDVEVELCAFTRGQQDEFITNWFNNIEQPLARSQGQSLRDAIDRSPQLQGMAQVPLLLTFLCLLAEANEVDWTTLTRAGLYHDVIQRMMRNELTRRLYRPFGLDGKREVDEGVEADWVTNAVAQLDAPAFSLFTCGKEVFNPMQARSPFQPSGHQVDIHHQGLDVAKFPTEELGFGRVRERGGGTAYVGHLRPDELPLIVPVSGPAWNDHNGEWEGSSESGTSLFRFIHRTFHEYLAGGFLAGLVNSGRQSDEERSPGWDAKIYAWQEILDDDGLPKKPEDGAPHTDAWRLVHVPVWQFVAKKAWDPRYKQPLLFLAGQLRHPNDKAELLDIVAFEQGGTVDGQEVVGEKDDLFRHRLALAAQMVPEIVPEGIDSWDDVDLGDDDDDQ